MNTDTAAFRVWDEPQGKRDTTGFALRFANGWTLSMCFAPKCWSFSLPTSRDSLNTAVTNTVQCMAWKHADNGTEYYFDSVTGRIKRATTTCHGDTWECDTADTLAHWCSVVAAFPVNTKACKVQALQVKGH